MASLTELQTRLAAYQAAETEVLTGGQSYAVDGQQFSRANLLQIQTAIRDLENRIACFPASSGSSLPCATAVFGGSR